MWLAVMSLRLTSSRLWEFQSDVLEVGGLLVQSILFSDALISIPSGWVVYPLDEGLRCCEGSRMGSLVALRPVCEWSSIGVIQRLKRLGRNGHDEILGKSV